jgi:methionyl aminopeptidase
VAPGVTTGELDAWAGELIRSLGARSAFLGYRGFPGYVCVSVNDEVVHGVPGPRRIRMGDIVSLDVGVVVDGYVGDTATTVMVGVTDPAVIRLVRAAAEALRAGIAQAQVGRRLSDVSHAIERTVREAGFSVVKDFVGHGIGRTMHEEPNIPNFGLPGRGPRLKAGMTLAIEPMVNMGVGAVEVMKDGWTVLTADRRPSAHFEHTVALQEGGPEILTAGARPLEQPLSHAGGAAALLARRSFRAQAAPRLAGAGTCFASRLRRSRAVPLVPPHD